MLPFSVFLRSGRSYYYVSFKNEITGRYLPAISTKQTKKTEALKQAWIWYREGIPHKRGSLDVKTASLRDTVRHADITPADAEFIVSDLKRRGLVISCVFSGAPDSVPLADYLVEFWDYDSSPYIRKKLRMEHSIHKRYVSQMRRDVTKFWKPFFQDKLLGGIRSDDLDSFIEHLNGIFYNKGDKKIPLSFARKNTIIKAGFRPLRWAFSTSRIASDVTQGIFLFSGKSAERSILTPDMAKTIFSQVWADDRAKTANMVSMVTGLRAGELQGLKFGDIRDDSLVVRHSWNDYDKLKTTKNNKERIVEVAFPSVIQSLRDIASLNPHGVSDDSYVFWASKSANKPMEKKLFVKGLRSALVASGLSEEQAAVYVFHSWRHFYTTYMRGKVDDKLLQKQTGHKTHKMLEHYGDHILPADREKIREAQADVFASFLPKTS